jgi:hypothetical protein
LKVEVLFSGVVTLDVGDMDAEGWVNQLEAVDVQFGLAGSEYVVNLSVDEYSPCCRVCGCTENAACEGGCTWIEEDLCSSCEGKEPDVGSPAEGT